MRGKPTPTHDNTAIANTWGNSSANPVVFDFNRNLGGINFDTNSGNYFIGSTTADNLFDGVNPVGQQITIAGAGPGGMCAGIKLLQAGSEDFVILERSGRVGGTWANARYRGLCCDTPSLL